MKKIAGIAKAILMLSSTNLVFAQAETESGSDLKQPVGPTTTIVKCSRQSQQPWATVS